MLDAIAGWYLMVRDGLEAAGALFPNSLIGGLVFALLLSWTFTQRMKRVATLTRHQTEGFAFSMAFLFCLMIATRGRLYPIPWIELAAAIFAGLVAPIAYKVLVSILGKRFEWVRNLGRSDA